jgi:hypothetical protein
LKYLGKTFNSCPYTTPYSPDFSPPDFLLFPKLQMSLKVRRFQTAEDIIMNITKELREIPQKSSEQCFQKWKRQQEWCTAPQRNYCEVDKYN